ncbi:hypothetical protein F4560_008678 [Saccharothrix ecbatanensis]|uniref:Uncharacterized protein n=1 Tax=Saccharothrix ecbatanensis TaxID=1105145 RepID=A0A7W9HV87_9PSEU|nr:hypothetical protein [Saccharothrix ecbatanensis]MBB5808910.1 hypothetical protein [Saccharothrix ecbatanensis]
MLFLLFFIWTWNYGDGARKNCITHLHQLQVVLCHRGQVAESNPAS